MSFADTYLKRYASGYQEDLPPVHPDVSFIAVVPVFHEDNLVYFFESLNQAAMENASGEVIFVFNYPDNCDHQIATEHHRHLTQFTEYIDGQSSFHIRPLVVNPAALPKQKAGPGLVRKIGMDIAIRRFNQLGNDQGILISLDADTLVDQHFLTQVNNLYDSGQVNTCVGYFEHLRVFNGVSASDLEAVTMYEIYMRMVKLGLSYAGYPHAFHSLGSNFSVRANAYVKAGGMGVQKSGEDFYFLNKCIPLGHFYEHPGIRVYPSSRPSDRVLFGTGPFIRDYQSQYPEGFEKYSWSAFTELKSYLTVVQSLSYQQSKNEMNAQLKAVETSVIERLGWNQKVEQAQLRAGDQVSFTKWIWRELDGLQMVHYLNEYQKAKGAEKVLGTAGSLLRVLGYTGCTRHAELVLKELRKYERNRGLIRIS